VLDSWAKRLASYRTADITRIRWLVDAEEREGAAPPADGAGAQGQLMTTR
jgi:hypothetical protein